MPAPAITSMSPTSGSSGGGTTVTITGTDFDGLVDVLIDGISVGWDSADNVGGIWTVILTTLAHAAAVGVPVAVLTADGEADTAFDFIDGATAEPCVTVEVTDFLADGATADANGIVYTPTLVGGWWDSIPLTSATAEMQPRGETITVAQELGREIALEITAHSPIAGTPLGPVLCFTAMETIKAAFRVIFVPVAFRVLDPFADRTLLARRVGPIKQTILGDSAVVVSQIPLLGEDPRRFPT